MRVLVVLLCIVAGGCSLGLDSYQVSKPPRPSDAVVQQGITGAFFEAKLTGSAEVSDIRPANTVSPGDWLICMKSSDPAQKRRYALYFTGFTYVTSQLASAVDNCDEATYVPQSRTVAKSSGDGPPLHIGEMSAQKK